MVDSPPRKNDEEYPLLKVETGGGDSGRPPAQPAAAPGWNVTCAPKRSWYERWPELFSACWMTGMLLGIFVLIIYGLGTLGVIRRQPIFVLNCNASKSDSEVYYHQIVQRGEHVQFSQFSEYLSDMATQYAFLHFSVFFLIDDSVQYGYRGQRHSRLMNKLLPHHSIRESGICDGINQQELRDFHLKNENVNVTIMPLSKFMAMTPLKYKWRTIPLGYLTFYARVFSVWKNGGIGIDLSCFSNQYKRRQMPDRRITAILKQYDLGSKPEEYAKTLNNIDRDEQNEFFGLFYGIVHQILNETRAFLNRSLSFNQEIISEPVIRKHRNKREVIFKTQNISGDNIITTVTPKMQLVNTSEITIIDSIYKNADTVSVRNNSVDKTQSFELDTAQKENGQPEKNTSSLNFVNMPIRNGSDGPQVVLLYDFSIFSDNMGPPYLFPESMQNNLPLPHATNHDVVDSVPKASYFLSVTMEGSFVAAMSKQHPFLGHILSAGCQRMPPRFAIQDALISQCSSIFKDDVYCSNIYVF
ncbi:uncharacterized protein LOC135074988 [Ostrinia nubilalis]|uniref:uncharacterized protein LOC135074988 n=1 Tax=Ostrinia nubilalis TaxID=29057 RepID=UPI00308269D7